MRGVQDTVRPMRYVLVGNGLSALACPLLVHAAGARACAGSAIANVAGQARRGRAVRPSAASSSGPRCARYRR